MRNYAKHMRFMISAFITSALFLVSYIVYHHFMGDTPFTRARFCAAYLFLHSHNTHCALDFCGALGIEFLSICLFGNFSTHRKVSKWTFPIWLYVSVTGVLVFFMLKIFG